jgi:hypothetical protein
MDASITFSIALRWFFAPFRVSVTCTRHNQRRKQGAEHELLAWLSEKEMVERLETLAPARSYLQAHRGMQEPS